MFWRKKKSVDRSHKITLRKEQMAKLATIAEAYDLDTNECITRLIDGFYSNPHTPIGQETQKVLASGTQAKGVAALNENPLFQLYASLPPEVQQALMQKLVGALGGQNEASKSFF